MLLEFIKALFSVGVVTGLASFVLFYWSMRAEDQHNEEAASKHNNSQSMHWARIEKVQRSGVYRAQSALLHKHWVEYGGGFYGLIAVLTLLWVEGKEVLDFLADHSSLSQLFQADIVGRVINLMIDAIMNAVMAFAWPAYWLAEIHSRHVWVWFLAAWLGYLAGKQLAEWQCSNAQNQD